MTAFTQGVSKVDQFPGNRGYDDLVRFPCFSQTIRKGLHGRVVMRGDQSSLEHHMPQGTATPCNGPLPAEGSTVLRHWGEPYESCSLFACYGAKLRHFGNQHCAGYGSDPGDGSQNTSGLCQQIVACDGLDDPVFQFLDQTVDALLQLGIDAVKHLCCAKLLMRADLSQQTFPHFDDLGPL